ncbi:MAG: hypothetical protein F6J87_11455 [Spirulina sp. SIO3F2]|nr:hypothetical protein [Spirulina sp. SIO3F2]
MIDSVHNHLYPYASYQGNLTPSELVFNANLQTFAQRVNYICGLETNGKITTQNAYEQVNLLWQQLQQSYETLER